MLRRMRNEIIRIMRREQRLLTIQEIYDFLLGVPAMHNYFANRTVRQGKDIILRAIVTASLHRSPNNHMTAYYFFPEHENGPVPGIRFGLILLRDQGVYEE